MGGNGIKTGGRDFKKGHPGGPGRPPLDPAIKEARQLTRQTLELTLTELMHMTPEQLKAKKSNPETIMLEHMVLSVITHGTNKGDSVRLNWLVEQVAGKLKDTVELSGPNGGPIRTEMNDAKLLTDSELKERLIKLLPDAKLSQ